MAPMPPTVATTSTLAMVRAAEGRGIETGDILRSAALPRQTIEDPDARIPGATVLAVWNALRERTGDPALQLTAPTVLPFGAYRVIEYMVVASPTVGEAMSRFARFFALIADAVSITTGAEGAEHHFTVATADGGPVPPLYVDYIFAAVVGRIRMKANPALAVHRVDLRHPAPLDRSPYTTVFRSPVRFGAAHDRLCFTDADWNSRMPHADAALAHILEQHARVLAERLPGGESGIVSEVQRAVAASFPEDASGADVARALCVSERTLQRKLVAAGTTFRDVSNSVRRELAEGYLADRQVSIAEVAFMLGFSDQSSFNRAFRRWTGESPGHWRKRAPARIGRNSYVTTMGDVGTHPTRSAN